MKYYVLLKDVPEVNAGAVFLLEDNRDRAFIVKESKHKLTGKKTSGDFWFSAEALDRKEWFEKVSQAFVYEDGVLLTL